MESKKLILASASPRRAELLRQAGFVFEIDPAVEEEICPDDLTCAARTEVLAIAKAREVLHRHPDAVVLGSDTLVAVDGRMLGKPKTAEEAKQMLRQLSGRSHQVCTSVCVCDDDRTASVRRITDVTFRPLSEAEIAAYVASGEPMDKAGAYGIQGSAAVFVKEISGDYSAVVGLPIAPSYEMLCSFGIRPDQKI